MLKGKLSTKLIGSFLAVSFVTLVVGLIGVVGISRIGNADKKMYENNLKGINDIAQIQSIFMQMRARALYLQLERFVLDDEKRATAGMNDLKEMDKKGLGMLAQFEKRIDGKAKAYFEQFKIELAKYLEDRDKMSQLAIDGKKQEAAEFMLNTATPQGAKVLEMFDRIYQDQLDLAQASAESNASTERTVKWMSGIAIVIGVALGLFFGMAITRSISRPVNRVVSVLGDGADEIASASGQLSGTSQSLAEGASQQAAAIEETSSSLEELSSITKRNADFAMEAKSRMGEAAKIVEKADIQLHQLVDAVSQIARSSEDTKTIIKTIDDITFQTNLLALNAAVEAARAGEAGAGFAVVADEVRSLAMRAAEAAKNTNQMVENIIQVVGTGKELSSSTMEAFQENTAIASAISDIIDEIAAASSEQAQGIGEINRAVLEMEKVIQQNAANAEESASASEELSAQAEYLKRIVGELTALIRGNGNGSSGRSFLRAKPDKSLAAAKTLSPVVELRKKDFGKNARNMISAGEDAPKRERLIAMEDKAASFRNF